MTVEGSRSARRADALSRDRILDAAVAILDSDGDTGLTLRAVMSELATGSGAIYYHVANMDELRAAAADAVLRRSLGDMDPDADAATALRAVAVTIFDAVVTHDWLATQLARGPFQPAVLLIWTTIGRQLHRMGLAGEPLSDAGSTLAGYLLGTAQQNGSPRQSATHAERRAFLTALADQWRSIDPDPLVDEIASRLPDHDDRRQFLAGVDIVLAGIEISMR